MADLWRATAFTCLKAAVASHAFSLIPADYAIFHMKALGRAYLNTDSAIYTNVYGFRIMAVNAIKIASLQEYGGPVSRTVYRTKRNYLIY